MQEDNLQLDKFYNTGCRSSSTPRAPLHAGLNMGLIRLYRPLTESQLLNFAQVLIL
jgi:hypothetical protein